MTSAGDRPTDCSCQAEVWRHFAMRESWDDFCAPGKRMGRFGRDYHTATKPNACTSRGAEVRRIKWNPDWQSSSRTFGSCFLVVSTVVVSAVRGNFQICIYMLLYVYPRARLNVEDEVLA